jgi:hypothetical protein
MAGCICPRMPGWMQMYFGKVMRMQINFRRSSKNIIPGSGSILYRHAGYILHNNLSCPLF